MPRLCSNRGETTIAGWSGGNDAHAHVCSVGGVGEEADRNEIDSSFGIHSDIFQTDAARAFHRNAPLRLLNVGPSAALDGALHVFWGHVIQKNRLGPVGESDLDFLQGADFNFDGLRAAAVAVSAWLSGSEIGRAHV